MTIACLALIALACAFVGEGLEATSLSHKLLCYGAAALCISLMMFALMARTIAEGP